MVTPHQPLAASINMSISMEDYGSKISFLTWLIIHKIVAAPNKEEETEKKPVAKRGRRALASVEEKREEEAPELTVPEPEVYSSTW